MKRARACKLGVHLIATAATLLILNVATANAVERMAEPGPPLLAPSQHDKPARQQAFRQQPSSPSVEWTRHKSLDGINPSPSEQRMMWLMNRARQDPTAEGVWLAESSHPDISGGRSYFGVDLDQLQAAFATLDPKPPAAFDIRLHDASELHSLDLIDRNAQDHTGQWDKVQATTFACNGARLSVFSYSTSALNAHAALNIDWGYGPFGMQNPPGHRYAIMGVWSYAGAGLTNVGLATVPENDPQTTVGPLVFSGAYCQAGSGDHNRFLVGTVWNDLDMDSEYDEGEGLSNVTVMPDQGTHYAVTGDAGGYAIPIEASGSYSVTFSGGGLGTSTATRTVDVGTTSVLLDLEFGLDSDNDGMPDEWEVQYGLNPLSDADANIDSDGDGRTNLQEYQEGTDPTDDTSFRRSGRGDLDGDGRSDILWRNNVSGQNWSYLMDGSSLFASESINTVGTIWTIAGTGDYNGDGKADILWRHGGTGQNWLHLMDGSTIMSSVGINTVPTSWIVAGNGDYDGDGKSDILWRHGVSGQNWMYLMDGATIMSSVGVNTVPTVWEVAGSGDHNGDGKADILWRHTGSGQNWMYLMDGAMIVSSEEVNKVPTIWQVAGTGDHNGDGKADILWRHTGSGQAWLHLIDGSQISSSVGVGTVPTIWDIAGDGDYDGDGKADILWRNSVTGQNWMYLMDGATISNSASVNRVDDLNWEIANVD